jgi:hypothetical protein
MNDTEMLSHISELVREEHALRGHGEAITDTDRDRLRHLEEQLDQAWDLLRRRRAREEAGQDPDPEREHSVREVEGYLQ